MRDTCGRKTRRIYGRLSSAPGHLTAMQAGEAAALAGVSKLLLTHLWPFYSEDVILNECKTVFPNAEVVAEGKTYSIKNGRLSEHGT